MRHYVILLLILIQVLAFAKEAPVMIIRNGQPFVRLTVIGPSVGITVSYDNKYKSVRIDTALSSEGFSIDSMAEKNKSQSYFTRLPDYPDRLYISLKGLINYKVITHFNKKLQTLVLFNQENELWLELNDSTNIKTLSPVKVSPKDPVNLDIVKLKGLINKYDGILKDVGAPLLYNAAEFGDIPTLTLLLDANVSPNIKNEYNLYTTALQLAVEKKQSKAAILLVSRGAVAESAYILSLAIQSNDVELVQELLKHGSNPNTRGGGGLTALHIAALMQNTDMAKLLVEHGAEVNSYDDQKRTPLLAATDPDVIIWDSPKEYITHISIPEIHRIVDYLISAGANINARDKDGDSILHNTVRLMDFQQYQTLLTNKDFRTPTKTEQSKMLLALMNSAVNLQNQMKEKPEIIAEMTLSEPGKDKTGKPVELSENERNKIIDEMKEKYNKNFSVIFADLLKREIDFSVIDENERTLLHYAVLLDDLSYANKLIDAGADVNLNDPLKYAILSDFNVKGTELLLQKGADVSKNSPFLLLDVRSFSGDFDKEIKIANHDNILAIAKLLVKYKANMTLADDKSYVAVFDDEWGGKAIHHAVNTGYPDLVELLLDNGADIEAGDNDGTTPLGIAADMEEADIMTLLIKRGAKINFRDNDDNTPLSFAIFNRSVECIKLLLHQPGIDIKNRGKSGVSYLMMAIGGRKDSDYEKWFPTFFSELLKRGCKVNDVDEDGRTALLGAVYHSPVSVRLLLEAGANVNLPDRDGNTPLHLCVQNVFEKENILSVTLLLKYGANVNALNKAGLSPLDIANREKHREFADILIKNHGKAWKYKKIVK